MFKEISVASSKGAVFRDLRVSQAERCLPPGFGQPRFRPSYERLDLALQ